MLERIAVRLLQCLAIVAVMSVIVFFGVSVIGNAVDVLISPEATAAERETAIQALGLNEPLWRQYLIFAGSVLRGEFGTSFVFGLPATTLIMQRLPATMELAFVALIMSLGLGLPLGLIAGLRPRSLFSRAIMSFSIIGLSLPAFWIGIMLMMVFSVMLGWLPATGRGATAEFLGIQFSFLTVDGLRHLLLPALTLSILKASVIIRMTRAGVDEVRKQDFVRFAQSKGLSDWRILMVHVVRNVMIPVVTVVGIEFGQLIAFAPVTETIFAWPGMGKLMFDSIQNLDRPVIVAYLMVVVVIVAVVNFIVDICYMIIDPRVRARGMA